MNAAMEGSIEQAEQLLQEGGDLEERDDFGWTPLHWASHRPDNLGMIQFLIDHGANLATKDECGQTAMDLSRGRELESNIAVLKKHDAPSNVHGSIFAAVKIGDIKRCGSNCGWSGFDIRDVGVIDGLRSISPPWRMIL